MPHMKSQTHKQRRTVTNRTSLERSIERKTTGGFKLVYSLETSLLNLMQFQMCSVHRGFIEVMGILAYMFGYLASDAGKKMQNYAVKCLDN